MISISRLHAIFLISILSLTLTQCVNLTPPQAASSFETQSQSTRQASLAALTHWDIQGAFSIQHQGKSEIANYTWQQRNHANYNIHISSTLNAYVVNVVGDKNGVILYQNNEKPLTASTPTELLEKTIGFSLPIDNLYYWVSGLAAPGKNTQTTDQYGHLLTLDQSGWHVEFSRYTHLTKDIDVPQLLNFNSDNLSIRLVIKKWQKK